MAAASRRIRSTGRSAAPARSQPPAHTTARAMGPTTASSRVRRPSASFRSPSVAPTTTTSRSLSRSIGTASKRTGSSTPCTRAVENERPCTWATVAGVSRGAAETPAEVSTIRSDRSST